LNWQQVLTTVSKGGNRACRRLNQWQVPAASSNGGSRVLLTKFETAIYFWKIIEN
jgi:hypothetical protein